MPGRVGQAGCRPVPDLPVDGLDRDRRLRHGQPARAGGLRHRPGPVQRVRVRPRRRARPDAGARRSATSRTPRTGTSGSAALSGWRSEAMRVPLSWLREYAPVPEPVDAAEVARRLTAAGLEVESVEPVGDIRGLVVAQVLTIEELAEFKKPIRYCRVATSEADLAADPARRCAASSAARPTSPSGDRVVLALPGAVLPGGFEIAARKTYGRVSEGMICSARRAGPRRGSHRDHRAAAGHAAGRRLRGLRGAARRRARDRRHSGPRLRGQHPRRGARAGLRLRRAVLRPGRCPTVRTWTCCGPGRRPAPEVYPASHRRPDRLRPVRAARGPRLQPRRDGRRCGCGSGWRAAGCARYRWPST